MKKFIYVIGMLMVTGLLAGCNLQTSTPVVADKAAPTSVVNNEVLTNTEFAKPLYTGDHSILFKMKTDGTDAFGIKVTAKFTQEFMDKYMYEDSTTYYFALKINDQYYNVFRNHQGGVSNDLSRQLNGAVPANKFKDGYTWYIPFGPIDVAKKAGEYGYAHSILNKSDEYKIGISSVKEGVQTHNFIVEYY